MGEFLLKKEFKARGLSYGFTIVRGSKITFQIVPDTTLENGLSMEGLAMTIYGIYESMLDRFKVGFNGISFKLKENFGYEIYMEKGSINFMFLVPEEYKSMIINKIENTWPKATIKRIQDFQYKFDLANTSYTNIVQREHFFKSIKCDLRTQAPLPSLLGVSNNLEEGDKLLIQYLFDPIGNTWRDKAKKHLEDYRAGINREKNFGVIDALLKGIFKLVDEFFSIFDLFFKIQTTHTNKKGSVELQELKEATKQKIKYDAFKAAIRIVCCCQDPRRREHIIKNAAVALKEISGDNELIDTGIKAATNKFLNFYKKGDKFMDRVINHKNDLLNSNIFSVREVAQLIQMPENVLQQDYNLQRIDVREINIPGALKKPGLLIGSTTYKGKVQNVYWPSDYNIKSLPKIVIGPMGAGKSEYLTNYIVQANKAGEAVVLFDYIKNNELSNKVIKNISGPMVVIDASDLKDPVKLSYDEIRYSDDPQIRKQNANAQAELIAYLMDALKEESTQPLSSRMQRYLTAAAMIVFINPGEGIETLQAVLLNHKIRAEYVKKALDSGIYNKNSMDILDLEALDVKNTKGVVTGTSDAKIEGIIDRLNVLNRNLYLRSMLSGSRTIDFVELLDKKYTIIIKIPESKFPTQQAKDTIVTFFTSKLRLAALIRGAAAEKPGIVHIVYDEVHKVETAAKFISSYIDEVRKYGNAFVFAVHYLKQFKELLEPIKAAGVSYMILAGTEKDNLIQLQEELQPFTIPEVLKLKKWRSLNIIEAGAQKAVFTSDLPKPL